MRDPTFEDYKDIADKFENGKLHLNIHATGCVLTIIVKLLEQINQVLIGITTEKGRFSEMTVKKFVVSYSGIRWIDFSMFSAFVAPKDDVWFQEEDSEDWKVLNSITKVVPLQDENKYVKEYTQFIEFFQALCTSLFKRWDDQSKLDAEEQKLKDEESKLDELAKELTVITEEDQEERMSIL